METKIVLPDCLNFPCNDGCCKFGADVWPAERQRLIQRGLATESDFTDPYVDAEGDLLYRTSLGDRGCIFLKPTRGCRLHEVGGKPEVCQLVPRSAAEAESMFQGGGLPCYPVLNLIAEKTDRTGCCGEAELTEGR
jgi:hypothetical protein